MSQTYGSKRLTVSNIGDPRNVNATKQIRPGRAFEPRGAIPRRLPRQPGPLAAHRAAWNWLAPAAGGGPPPRAPRAPRAAGRASRGLELAGAEGGAGPPLRLPRQPRVS